MSGNPRSPTPNTDSRLAPIEDRRTCRRVPLEPSFVDDMGEVADDIRQLATDFGARPYRVFCVVVSWTGREVGRGTQAVLAETELLPTPRIDLTSLRYVVTSGGRTDDGYTKLYEVSPRYTEDDIHSLFYRDLLPGEQAFIEVRMDARDGRQPVRHRLTVSGVPFRDADGFQWVVPLKIQQEERNRDGTLSERNKTTAVHPLTTGMPVVP
jgi:hypothetical protein